MSRIADDFDSIRARLAELRGGEPARAEHYHRRVSAILKSLRVEATMDARAYVRGADAKAAADALAERIARQIVDNEFFEAYEKLCAASADAFGSSER